MEAAEVLQRGLYEAIPTARTVPGVVAAASSGVGAAEAGTLTPAMLGLTTTVWFIAASDQAAMSPHEIIRRGGDASSLAATSSIAPPFKAQICALIGSRRPKRAAGGGNRCSSRPPIKPQGCGLELSGAAAGRPEPQAG
jgi:hypothetical protein